MIRAPTDILRIALFVFALVAVSSPLICAAETIRPIREPAGTLSTNAAFASAVEALGMMMQAVGNLEEKVRSKDLSSIHQEDLIVNASLSAILGQANRIDSVLRARFTADIKQFGQHVGELHLAGDTQRQDQSERSLSLVLQVFERIKAYFPQATLDAAKDAASRYLCPTHRDVLGKRTDTCPKCGAPLDQQVRILPAFCGLPMPSKQSVRATIRLDPAAAPGTTTTAFLKLTQADGSPVYASDLMVAHTERIHLLMIDASLSDYQHEHPRPTRVPGEYSFPFTPRMPGSYFAWADVRLAPIGLQDYAAATIPAFVPGERPVDRSLTNIVTADGLTYELTFTPGQLKVERVAFGKLRITGPDGSPFTRLEPLMASFAHFVGFSEDRRTILHLHPKAPPVLNQADRGGPELEFRFFASQAGFYRLFVQVQIKGSSKFIPFGLQVGR